jgi:hypothetical protein
MCRGSLPLAWEVAQRPCTQLHTDSTDQDAAADARGAAADARGETTADGEQQRMGGTPAGEVNEGASPEFDDADNESEVNSAATAWMNCHVRDPLALLLLHRLCGSGFVVLEGHLNQSVGLKVSLDAESIRKGKWGVSSGRWSSFSSCVWVLG